MSYMRTVSATVTGLVVFHAAVLGAAYWKWGRDPGVEKGSILRIQLSGSMAEYPPGGFTSGILAADEPTLHTVLDNLDKASVDDRVTGVLITLTNAAPGYAMLEEIRAEIQDVRDAGKPVWAWSDQLGFRDLYLASACDSFFVHPNAYISLGGIYAGRVYVAGTLEKLGIQAQTTRIESYKSAAEMTMRTDMSPEAREMTEWILADIYPRVLEETATGLGVGATEVERAMERAVLQPQEFLEFGLADGLREWDEMKAALPRPKGEEKPRLLGGSVYDGVSAESVGRKGKKKIAVVHAQGLIAGAESGVDPLLGVTMGYASVNADLQRALDDDDVVGVVFRVDSPGGESLTSDRMSRMIEVVDREKPVVVSMVDVAASGGYSISYRARKLLADGHTITGSIGSITGKFVFHDLYHKLGITQDGVGMGPNPDFYSDYRAWTEAELSRVQEDHWASYFDWVNRIARFRGMEPAEVDSVGRGRVWTGRQALEHRLIDGIGGLEEAVAAVLTEAGLDAEASVTLVHYPQPEGFLASILGMPVSAVPERLALGWVRGRVEEWRSLGRADLELMDLPVP